MTEQARIRPKLNLDKAQALGLRFCAERNARRESQQDIADALLLSKLQIMGLETGDRKSFYSDKMFGQAADKYASHLGFDDKPSEFLFSAINQNAAAFIASETIAVEKEQIDFEAEAIADTEMLLSAAPPRKSASFKTAFIAIVVASVIIVSYLATRTQPTVAAPQPGSVVKTTEITPPNPTPAPTETATTTPTPLPQAQPEQKELVKPESVKTEPPTKQSATNSVSAGHILIKFSASSWVQTVDKNGNKQEKIYKSGETLDLEPANLQALVIGNVSSVTVNSNKTDISLKPYVTPGSQVARIIGADVRKLGE